MAPAALTSSDVEEVRVAVYQGFATSGHAPGPSAVARSTGLSAAQVRAALERLHASRDLVLRDGADIVMAHPFSSVPLGFSVMGERKLWWGGCAWDSFAIPHLVPAEPEVLVATRCPGCGDALAWVVDRHRPPSGAEVAHFLTPTRQIWDDVVHACRHQQLFCSDRCVGDWLRQTGNQRGYVMDLGTLWRLARGWYAGRLDRGYQRRDPASAAAYFADVGLQGPFWGLPG